MLAENGDLGNSLVAVPEAAMGVKAGGDRAAALTSTL